MEKQNIRIKLRAYDNKILDNNGLIIMHRHKKKNDVFPAFLSIVEEKTYGIAKIIFLSFTLK